MKRWLLSVLLTAYFLSSNTQGQDNTYKVDLSGKEKGVVNMNLSSIAADVEYIALETTPKSYISRVLQLVKTENNLLILDQTSMKSERLLIFKLNGSFITLIHKVGKGPGEYTNIDDFTFDPKNQYITILDSGQKKVLQFSLSGQFIREIPLDIRPSNICFIEPEYFVATIPLRIVKPADDGKLYNIIVYDQDLKVKKRIASSVKSSENPNTPYLMTGGLSSYENKLRYKQPFVDQIYTLDKKLDYQVFSNIDFGTYRTPESVYGSIANARSQAENYKELHSVIESRNFFYVKYRYKRMFCTYVFNKANGAMTNLSGKQGDFGFNNDLDGSMPFWPDLSTGPDELYRSFNAIDFIELCDQYHAKKFKSKFPVQQKRLLEVLGKLDENSNPVIQVVTLKRN
jgi:hypothetical protein